MYYFSGKGRSPVVTLTTREPVKLPVQQVSQIVAPARGATTATTMTTASVSFTTAHATSTIVTQVNFLQRIKSLLQVVLLSKIRKILCKCV